MSNEVMSISKAASTLGLSPSAFRQLVDEHAPGEVQKNGRRRVVTTRGVEIVQQVAQEAAGVKNTPPPQSAPSQGQIEPVGPEKEELEFHRSVSNPRMITAMTRDGSVVRVRVKNPDRFAGRMRFMAKKIPGHQDFYEMAQKEPRRKGRW